MEDISRELEREIAKAKPAPYKARREKKILIIDDFGETRPGGYLKTLARVFFMIPPFEGVVLELYPTI